MKCKWDEVYLCDCPIDIIDGDRGKNYPSGDDFSNNGYCLFLNAKNVTILGFSFEQTQFITKQKDQMLKKGKLNRNDVILTTRGTVGNVAYYNDNVPFDNIRINSGMVILRTNLSKVDSKYLYWLFRSPIIQEQIHQIKTGSAQPQLPISTMKKIKFLLPPIYEQKAIAAVLSVLDDKIELNNRINKNLEAQAQAIFKSWFVDFEPFRDGEFVDSELGPIPKGWRVVCFKKILSVRSEKTGNRTNAEYSVTNTGIHPRSQKFKKRLSSSPSKNKLILKGDLVFGMSRNILNWGIMKDDVGGVSSAYHVYSIDTCVPTWYVEEFIASHLWYFKDLIRPSAREGQGIDSGALANKIIFIPPKDTLKKYYSIREILRKKTLSVDAQSQTLAALCDTPLPKLMSGEIRVPLEV